MKWILRGIGALLALVVLAAATLIVIDQASLPKAPPRQALLDKAKAYDVRIRRDDWGVPHVLGKTDADAAFGLGYAQSEDDFATLQDVVLATRGVLARDKGKAAAATDYVTALLDVWPTTNAHYDQLPAELRRILEAYANGVSVYAAKHPEKVKAGLLPLTGHDIEAGFVFKQPFFYGLDGELKHLTSPLAKQAAGAPPTPEKGSNGLATAPTRDADGATRLLVNSHQPYTGPVAWYEAVVESGQGWHVAGGFFPGSPFMLHGHNADLGWANTVSKPDLVDIYRLTLNPANRNQYRLDGQWKDFERRYVTLRVKLWGPLVLPVKKAVLRSAHGPVLETDHGVFAIRYAGMGEWRQPLQYWRLNRARTVEEWRAAIATHAIPSLNYVYADRGGNIGFVHNGQYPNRTVQADWAGVLPGDRSDLIWRGYRPVEQSPQLWNPKSGLVFNSNNTPFQASEAADNLKPEAFPASLGLQTNMTNRAWRALETFGSDHAITEASFRAHKFDVAFSDRSSVMAMVREVIAVDPQGDVDLARAQAILRGWDKKADVHDRGAALAALMTQPILFARSNGDPAPAPIDSLRATIKLLKTHFGRLDPEWGEVNRIRRGALNLPIDGAADTYRSVWGKPEKDGTTTAEGGDTFIMFVSWDRNGALRSESIHQFGSATLDARSPHYADQTPLFVAMKTKPVWFTESQLKGHVKVDYRPGER